MDREDGCAVARPAQAVRVLEQHVPPFQPVKPQEYLVADIPNNPSRAHKYPPDRHLCAQRHLIECCFSRLKQFRRVATRYEKTARNDLAIVTVAAIILWIR